MTDLASLVLINQINNHTQELYRESPWKAKQRLRNLERRKLEEQSFAIDVEHIQRQIKFSKETFGPGPRTWGIIDHLRKEITEWENDPNGTEWADIIILAIDGAWREGYTPAEIISAVKSKQIINESREWPDWRTAEPGKAIEHVRL